MPKIELHVHLEGATEPSVFWELANRNGLSSPAPSLASWEESFTFRDFNHFIEIYMKSVACLKKPEDYYFLTERFLGRQASENILWTEAFISLSHLPPMDGKELLAALADGLSDAQSKHGVSMTFIGDIARHEPETQEEVLSLVMEGARLGVFSGLGLGGIEKGFPAGLFADTYQKAIRAGLKVHAHAGETTGPEAVLEAVTILGAMRIGHGIGAARDPNLMARLAASRTPFEVCPQSNYALGVVPLERPHPIRLMVDAGLLCTVNSDDPAMFSTSLTNEYLVLAEQGFSFDELWRLNCNALEAAHLRAEARTELEMRFADFHKELVESECKISRDERLHSG